MKVFITGGAGFVGSNVANYFAIKRHEVLILDNLSASGAKLNLDWLRGNHPGLQFWEGDIRQAELLDLLLEQHPDVDVILHFAACASTPASIRNPRTDFETNALGTLNLLEAVRRRCPGTLFIFPSTHKVYGALDNVPIIEKRSRWEFRHLPRGVSEEQPLHFHSPHACSKGAADQYVRAYTRTYGLRTVILRQSSTYGLRQFGTEDHGWIAWFTIAAVLGKPVTIYGDGKQMRDILFIDDLLALLDRILEMRDEVAGKVYNVGGGKRNTLSVRELLHLLRELTGRDVEINLAQWRPGDQPVYVSDITRAEEDLQWEPRVSPRRGVSRLYEWVMDYRHLFDGATPPHQHSSQDSQERRKAR